LWSFLATSPLARFQRTSNSIFLSPIPIKGNALLVHVVLYPYKGNALSVHVVLDPSWKNVLTASIVKTELDMLY